MNSKSKKTILFILPQLYPCVTGGIEIFHYYFIRHIAEYYNVEVITTCDKVDSTNSLTILPYQNNIFKNQTISRNLFLLKQILNKRKSIDLIHLPYSSKSFVQEYQVILAKQIMGIPYILRIHGGGMFPGRPNFMHQKLFDNAAGIIGVSSPIKAEYEKRHGRPIDMIPSMLPYNHSEKNKEQLRQDYDIKDTELVLLFLGSIKSIKGPDILLNAVVNLGLDYSKQNNLKVIFAGDGPMRSELEETINHLELREHILFLGNVPYENVCDLYKLTDIFIIPSLHEARPLTLSEALYNGCPSLGSDISTITNIIENEKNGMIFEAGKSDDLGQKLKILIEQPELRNQLGKTAQETYQGKYDYSTMIQDYCRFYDKILIQN